MSNFMITLKNKYEKLSKTEKKVADFLISSPQNEIPLYITDFAKLSDTSEATIVRFSKKLGFTGYQQLKIALAQDNNYHPVDINITSNDLPITIFNKVCEDIYMSLEKTKNILDSNSLQTCCDKVLHADKILLLGLGNSSSIAIDAAHKLFRIGLNATAYTDNHMQSIAVSYTTKNSVVIGFSHSGRSADILQSLQVARDNGATTVAVTNRVTSPIEKVSDIVLQTQSDETNYRILGLSSRIAQLAIVDAIYSYLVCHIDNVEEKINNAELALKSKKL